MSILPPSMCQNPNELSFVYMWRIPIFRALNSFNVFGDSETFRTTYQTGSFEWIIHLYRSNFGFPIRPRVQLYLEQSRATMQHPSPIECRMSFTVVDDSNPSKSKPTASVIAQQSQSHLTFHSSYRIPNDCQFIDKLTECFVNVSNIGKTICIIVDLLFDSKSFSIAFPDSFSTVPAPPREIKTDFRWAPLSPNYNDFTIHCHDGDLKTSKSALFLSSPFFRTLFTSNEAGLIITEYSVPLYHKTSTQQIILFLITGTFEMPENITTDYTRELIDVALHFRPLNIEALRNTIHKSLCELLKRIYYDMEETVRLLVFAHEMNFANLKQMCMAAIAYEHYRRFKQTFNEEASAAERIALFERLRHEGFLLSVSPITRIDAIRRQSAKCRLVLRYGNRKEIISHLESPITATIQESEVD